MAFDRAKFKALVHYIIWKAGKRDSFGATKLNKVLWFADARAYMLTGQAITGARYVREKWGPVPHQIMPIRAELQREGTVSIINSRGGGDHTKFMADYAPDLSIFTAEEIENVDYWINFIDREHTATSISDESHDYSWEIAPTGQEIPIFAFIANRARDPNDEEMAWARKRADELNLP